MANRSHSRKLIIQLTPPETRNPYYTMLAPELERHGFDTRYTTDYARALTWIAGASGPSIVHVHQVDGLYPSGDRVDARNGARALVNFLIRARARGAAVIHTLHNRRPHDSSLLDVYSYAERMAGALATRIVVHGTPAELYARQVAASGKIRILPHPSFAGFYGPLVEQAEARARLALQPDEYVILSLGDLKPYKGHELILDGFERASLPRSRLVVAGGSPPSDKYVSVIEDRARAIGLDRVRIVAATIPEEMVPIWLSAADLAVYGFEEILMSGSMMLSLSYGLPAVVPDLGCLSEYVIDGKNGYLYRSGNALSLSSAFVRAHEDRLDRESVMSSMLAYAPDNVAAGLADIFDDALGLL